MKKMKNNLDEMQELTNLKIMERGFWIMFWGLGLVIMAQSFPVSDPKAVSRQVMGETIVLLIGGAYAVGAEIKNGIWSKGIPATPKANLLVSLVAASVFAAFRGAGYYVQYGDLPVAMLNAAVNFIFMGVVCFVVLTVLTLFYHNRKNKLEQEDGEEKE